jgi:ABC-2 type transport system permease protein
MTSVSTSSTSTSSKSSRETSPTALVTHTLVQTERLIVRWARDPLTMVQGLVFPALLLIMLGLALGNRVSHFANTNNLYGAEYDSVYGFVPMAVLTGIMAGSAASAISLGRERESGLLSRFWVLPVHRASGLIARICAEGVRIIIGTVLIVAVGFLFFGFRFEQGYLAALAFLALPTLFGLAFATLVTAIAVRSAKAAMIEAVSLVSSVLTFFSTGFVPLEGFPEWVRGIVANQPLTTTIEAMRGLSFGGPVARPLFITVLWCVAVIAICAGPAAIGYRRASRK